MFPSAPSPALLLGAASEIATKLSEALEAHPTQQIELSRDEAILSLALIEAAIVRLAQEIGAAENGPT